MLYSFIFTLLRNFTFSCFCMFYIFFFQRRKSSNKDDSKSSSSKKVDSAKKVPSSRSKSEDSSKPEPIRLNVKKTLGELIINRLKEAGDTVFVEAEVFYQKMYFLYFFFFQVLAYLNSENSACSCSRSFLRKNTHFDFLKAYDVWT